MRIQYVPGNNLFWPYRDSWVFAKDRCVGCTKELVPGSRARCMNCDGLVCGGCLTHDKVNNELLCRLCFSTD